MEENKISEKKVESEAVNLKKKKLNIQNLVKPKEKKFLAVVVMVSLVFGFIGSVFGNKVLEEVAGIKNIVGDSSLGTQNLKLNENSALIDAVNKVNPSVVSITTEQSRLDFFGEITKSKSSGTGFIISSDGLIITNKHVVSDKESSYSVFTNDGKEYKAAVKSRDPLNDIAFLKVEAKGLKAVEIGNSDDLKIGQQVVAIGNALGQYQNTVTQGIVSAKGRAVPVGDQSSASSETLENVIQTDAAINPGNSGGPLINLAGQVVGINTAIDSSGQGIGFAIPINMVKTAIKSVEEKGKVVRPYLGVRYIPITKEFAARNDLTESNGVLVYGGKNELAIVPGSPADKAGIADGDIIIGINGKKIDKDHTLIGLLQNYSVGETIRVDISRNGEKKSIEVKLAESK